MSASKTKGRTKTLKEVTGIISSKSIFEVIDYRNKSEDSIKQFMYQPLKGYFEKKFVSEGMSPEKAEAKANSVVTWESNINTTLHNMEFCGTYHRPDFKLNYDGLIVALEIKRGCTGEAIRSGLGQCLVYQTVYDFTICLFIDTSDDKHILKGSSSPTAVELFDSLWNNHNAMFVVI